MTELIKIDAAKAGTQLSEAVSAARKLVESASSEIVRDLVQVQAQMMIEAALTDDVRALILAAGRAGHYEVIPSGKGGTVPDSQIVAVCVQAYTRGLSLAGQEFAVFPKRGGGASLYIKANGYRHLFAASGRAGDMRISVGYPEVRPLEVAGRTKDASHESGGKAVALMAGKASVVWDGKLASVEASGEYRIGIPCYVTDNIDGLQAKAERRLLMKLWQKCSGVREVDPETTDEVEPVTYDIVTDPAEARDWEKEKSAYVAEWKALPDCSAKDLYLAVMREESAEGIASIMHDAATEPMDGRHRAAIDRAAHFRLEWLASREDMP